MIVILLPAAGVASIDGALHRVAHGAGMTVETEHPSLRPVTGRLEADHIVARDGAVLPLQDWRPDTPPHAIVLAIHGFNDHATAFAAPAAMMARHGIATFAYDQRGFGRAPMPGHWAGTGRMVDDAIEAITLLNRRYPDVPLYVMGESMGAAVAILAALRNAVGARGFILLAPAVWSRDTMSLFERVGLWLAEFLPAMVWAPRLLPMTIRPTDNAAVLRALHDDPLVIKTVRSDTLNALVDLMGEALAAAPSFTARALILYGEQDGVVPRAPVARFVASLPAAAADRQRVAVYPAGFHLLLRDNQGPLVTADVIAWIGNAQAPLPSGADRDGRERLLAPMPAPGRGAAAAPFAAT